MRYIAFFALFIFVLQNSIAQYTFEASIPKVDSSGYYELKLSPEIIALSSTQFSDMRIVNNSGKEVAYLVKELSSGVYNDFKDFSIIKSSVKDSINTLIIDNQEKRIFGSLLVTIRKANVNKFVSVRGSDNLSNWYIVQRRMPVYDNTGNEEHTSILPISFPNSNFRYYELTFTNTEAFPLDIVKVSTQKQFYIPNDYEKINTIHFEQNDSLNKHTYIQFSPSKYSYHVAQIKFKVSYPKYFYRKGFIYDKQRLLSEFILSSEMEYVELGDILLTPDLYINIDNQDSEPLTIDSITMYSQIRNLIVYLKVGEEYKLMGGNKNLSKPSYDLGYFRTEIPDKIPQLKANDTVFLNNGQPSVLVQSEKWFERPLFLWFVIIVVAFFLIWVCYKMMKEMKNDKK